MQHRAEAGGQAGVQPGAARGVQQGAQGGVRAGAEAGVQPGAHGELQGHQQRGQLAPAMTPYSFLSPQVCEQVPVVNCRKVPRQQCSPVCKPTYYCEVCQENDSYGAPQVTLNHL